MSDTDRNNDESAAPQSADRLTPDEESRVSAALALAAEQEASTAAQSDAPDTAPPPGSSDAQPAPAEQGQAAGAETPPGGSGAAAVPGDAPPVIAEPAITESKPQPFDIEKTALIETPTQGAALERGQEIPPAEAEPIKGTEVAGVAAAAESASTGTGTDPIEEHAEHPRDTIARMRAKLDAYGSECLKAVQPEIEYLISLCEDDPPGA